MQATQCFSAEAVSLYFSSFIETTEQCNSVCVCVVVVPEAHTNPANMMWLGCYHASLAPLVQDVLLVWNGHEVILEIQRFHFVSPTQTVHGLSLVCHLLGRSFHSCHRASFPSSTDSQTAYGDSALRFPTRLGANESV
eukprot:5732051-Amphidinium_carterae.1